MDGFRLDLITGGEPPLEIDENFRTCCVCDETYEVGLEACSGCYNSVSGSMSKFQITISSPASLKIIAMLGVEFHSVKDDLSMSIVYTATSHKKNKMVGRGITRAEAFADLLSRKMLGEKDSAD